MENKPFICIRLKHALESCGINASEAAAISGLSAKTFTDTLLAKRKPLQPEMIAVETWLMKRIGVDRARGLLGPLGLWGLWDVIRLTRANDNTLKKTHERLAAIKRQTGRKWADIAEEVNVQPNALCAYARQRGKLPPVAVRRVMTFIGRNRASERIKRKQKDKIVTILERNNIMAGRRSPAFLTDKALTHFGLSHDPFTAGVETVSDVWLSPSVRKGIEIIEQGLRRRKGILAFYGRSGTGKTVLAKYANMKLTEPPLNASTRLVFLADVAIEELTPGQFMTFLYKELAPGKPAYFSLNRLQRMLIGELVSLHDNGQQLVVFIDEAHGLSSAMLKGLKRFIEAADKDPRVGFYGFPMLIVLFGHDELRYRLEGAEMEEVKGRIYQVEMAMRPAEVRKYVAHRMGRALGALGALGANGDGRQAADLLDEKAYDAMIHALKQQTRKDDDTRITPLDVNICLSRAFARAYDHKEKRVTAAAIAAALGPY